MRGLLILTTFLLTLVEITYSENSHVVRTYEFEQNGEKFNAWILIPSLTLTAPSRITRLLIDMQKQHSYEKANATKEIFTDLETWVYQKYKAEGLSEQMLEKLMTEESMQTNRSGVVFISKHNDRKDIQAMIRVDGVSSTNPLLPLEKRLLGRGLNKKLPRKSLKFQNVEESLFILDKPNQYEPYQFLIYNNPRVNSTEKSGACVEIKNFINSSKENDFIPLLFALAESHNILKYASTEKGAASISDYYLETDGKARQRYYSMLGWSTYGKPMANPDMPESKTQRMHISRSALKNKLEQYVLKRSKGSLLTFKLKILCESIIQKIAEP